MEQGVLLTLGLLTGIAVLVVRSIVRFAVIGFPPAEMRFDIACIVYLR